MRKYQSKRGDKAILSYYGDMHFCFNTLGAIWPKYGPLGLTDMANVLGVKKDLTEMKGKDPAEGRCMVSCTYYGGISNCKLQAKGTVL